jgi:hypothetical protein
MRYGLNMVLRQKGNGQFFSAAQKSIQYGSSLVADGKQFTSGFCFQGNSQRIKPSDRCLFVKSAEDSINNFSVPVKIGSGHLLIGHIAAPTARDQNFGSNGFGAIEENNAKRGIGFCREDASCQSCGTGPYDGNVGMLRH